MRLHAIALLGSFLFVAPLTGAPTLPITQNPRALDLASTHLVVQPGDTQAFARGLQNPMAFIQIAKRQEFSGSLMVRAKDNHTPSAFARIEPLVIDKSPFVEEYIIDIPAGMDEATLASILMATGDYQYAQPNWILYPAETIPNDPQFGSSWQHSRIKSTDAWDLHTGDSSVIVAVCDTGVDLDHPDLEDALVPGYNAVRREAQVDGGQVDDINGHGTFVAGCAAAIGNNNTGVVGVGWNLSIMPIRVSNNSNGGANSFSIANGARWAASQGAQVINVSYEGVTSTATIALSKDLKEMGALLFYAAGNDNINIGPDRPDIVVVSSTTSSDTKSSFSNYGNTVSVAAPGSSVRSTRRGGGYRNSSGTSYASPIAAGVGAMIFSTNLDLGPDDVQEILYASVDDLGAPGRDPIYGFGRVNTFNAILEAQSYTPRVLLPIVESFESSSWTDLLNVASGSVAVIADAQAPQGAFVLALDNTDILESVLLAGRQTLNGDYLISLMVKAQGVEAGESLELQYRDSTNTWTNIITMPSFGIDTEGFVRIDAPLDENFGYHGVSFRILAHGSDASDVWLIDDLRIEPAPEIPLTAPFLETFDTGVLSSQLWDQDQTSATIGMANNQIALELADEAAAETHDIDASAIALEGAFLNFFAFADADSDDELHLEYRDFFGNWQTFDTIAASQLDSAFQGFSYEIPLLGLGTNLRIRLSTPDDGSFFVDNLEINTSPLVLGCGQADLADPIGTLDILDVFAFLDAYNTSDSAADFTGDGIIDIADVFAFLTSYNAGCP